MDYIIDLNGNVVLGENVGKYLGSLNIDEKMTLLNINETHLSSVKLRSNFPNFAKNIEKELKKEKKMSYKIDKIVEIQRSIMDLFMSLEDMNNGKYLMYQVLNGNFMFFVQKYITNKEGLSFCMDKAIFVQEKFLESLEKNKNISLYQSYKGCKDVSRDKWSEQAYWSPKTIDDTDSIKKAFVNWLNLKIK